MSTLHTDWPAPSKVLMALEGGRALLELGALACCYPMLRASPRGDGHSVVVLPGLLASDAATALLRRYLREQGYDPHGWRQGLNRGPRRGVEQRMVDHLLRIVEHSGRPVSLIGWSLGGIYARELARQAPQAVRQVITLGSPLRGSAKATNAGRVYEWASGSSARGYKPDSAAPPVPCTAIYSQSDGIVAWQCSLEEGGPHNESIEVRASHWGLIHHPAVLYAIADRLAQPAGIWMPFDDTGWRRSFYRKAAAAPSR